MGLRRVADPELGMGARIAADRRGERYVDDHQLERADQVALALRPLAHMPN